MLSVKDGVITLTKGDTAYLSVALTDASGQPYELQTGDLLTLTIRRVADAESDVLLTSVSDTTTLTLTAEQTALLPVGPLSYDIQLTTQAGEVFTVVGASTVRPDLRNFVVLPEVTV